ncbi:MAG TPA: histidine kinase [Bacteroidota bacterium]|jgi:two-component system NarL family sensor kinase|nr:histidine kinase [Bacteroidota bacterium]
MSASELIWIVIVGTTIILSFIGFIIALVVVNQRRFIASQNEKLKESKRAEELLRQIPKRIIEAQEQERARVARELHDGVNQMLASIKYRLHSAKTKNSTPEPVLTESLEHLLVDLERTMEEVKRLSHNLHPKALDDLGFQAAVRSLCDEFTDRTRIPVEYRVGHLPRELNHDEEVAVFRIIQESLRNIERHAHASEVTIAMARNGEENAKLKVLISDNGRGFDSASAGVNPSQRLGGLGITTMAERATIMGGRLDIQSKAGEGTIVTLHLPVPQV